MMNVRQAVALVQAFAVDEGHADHLPPLDLGGYTPMRAKDRRLIRRRLAADQRAKDDAARQQGRDLLAERVAAHREACARFPGAVPFAGFAS